MMSVLSQHHPDDNLLTEFVSGSLDRGQAIAVSAHLHYCSRCRNRVAQMNAIGGALFSLQEQGLPEDSLNTEAEVSNTLSANNEQLSFDSLMTTIEQLNTEKDITAIDNAQKDNDQQDLESMPETSYSGLGNLPKTVRKMVEAQSIQWKQVTSDLKSANLMAGQKKYGVYLQKIAAGGKVPEHDHKGSEITVVLRGSISDEDGVYHAGDFILKQPGDIHRPRASGNEDCLCLSIQEAPVLLTGLMGRLINPFLKINAV